MHAGQWRLLFSFPRTRDMHVLVGVEPLPAASRILAKVAWDPIHSCTFPTLTCWFLTYPHKYRNDVESTRHEAFGT